MKEKEIYNDNRTRPDMFIRRATEDDLDTLIRISRKVFPHYLKWCGPKRQAKRWWLATFESQSNEIWVCQSGSKVIGMVIMVTDIELYQKERHRLRPRLGTVLCAFTVRPWLFVANIMGKIACSMNYTYRQTAKTALALLFGAIILLPVPEARADVSVQDKEVLEAVDKVAPTVEEIAKKLWDLSEVGLVEVKSSVYLKDLLKNNGFTITSEGTAGVPTAFIAGYGTGEPKIGIMLEYDALPGLGNEPVPQKQPRKDGVTAGHGCGHNLVGAGAMGAALALKDLMEEKGIPGTLRVYGAAAEESEGAKVFMAREGLFDNLNAVLHWHPMEFARVRGGVRSQAGGKHHPVHGE